MNFEQNLHNISFWTQLTLTILIVLVSVEAGFRYGDFKRRQKGYEKDTSVGTLVAAMLGLLAFFMAFTFGMAGSYFEARKMIVLKESNAIGTAYLRADVIPEPERGDIRRLLREYVNVRMDALTPEKLNETIMRSEKIHNNLWAQFSTSIKKNPPTSLTPHFMQALNEVITVHSERILTGVHKYVPGIIWVVLYFIMAISMLAVGYQFSSGGVRNRFAAFILAFAFSAAMVLIADLDNPGKGLIKTSQWSMSELQKKLNNDAGIMQKNKGE